MLNLFFFSLPIASPYSGTQLFMPAFPFIAILAGIGAGWVFDYVKRYTTRENTKKLIIIILALLLIIPGFYAIAKGNSCSGT